MLYTESSCTNILYLTLQIIVHLVMFNIPLSMTVSMLNLLLKSEYNGTEKTCLLEEEL